MRSKLYKSALTLTLLAAVLCLHAFSLSRHRFFKVGGRWDRSTVQFKVFGHVIARSRIYIFADFAIDEYIDASSRLIAEAGYAVKFYARQFPEFLFEGQARPKTRFYFREESCVQYAARRDEIARGADPAVGAVIRKLLARGVEVVLVPLPTKISLERDRLPARLPRCEIFADDREGQSAETPYENYRVLVDQAPDRAVDLFRAFSDYEAAHPDAFLWVPSDSHWASLGVAVTAGAVIERLRALGWNLKTPRITEVSSQIDLRRDMFTYTRVPRWLIDLDPGLQWVEPLYAIDRVARTGRTSRRVILAGTSYSTRLVPGDFGFGAVLAQALGRTLIDVSVSGGRSTAALLQLKANGIKLRRGDLLVWEFPLRNYPKAGDLAQVLSGL